jgi:hypothetical protein
VCLKAYSTSGDDDIWINYGTMELVNHQCINSSCSVLNLHADSACHRPVDNPTTYCDGINTTDYCCSCVDNNEFDCHMSKQHNNHHSSKHNRLVAYAYNDPMLCFLLHDSVDTYNIDCSGQNQQDTVSNMTFKLPSNLCEQPNVSELAIMCRQSSNLAL